MMNGTTTPEKATSVAVPPTFISSDDLTSRPTRNSRNIAPKSDKALSSSFGASHPKTLGPTNTPARISPTIPGWPSRSATSAISLAETKITSIESGIFAGPSALIDINRAGKPGNGMEAVYAVGDGRRRYIATPAIPATTGSSGAPCVTNR